MSLISYSAVSLDTIAIGMSLTIVYLVYDIAKAPLIEQPQSDGDFPLGFDLVEKYLITNSLSGLRLKSKGVIYVLSRLFGPLAYLNVPKYSFDSTLVYDNEGVTKLISSLIEESGGRDFKLQHRQGEILKNFLATGNEQRITVLIEGSPKTIYPYLFDNKPSGDAKNWTGLDIVVTKTGGTAGRVFIQKFRGVYVKTKKKMERNRDKITQSRAFQFIIIGERAYVQYLKQMIEMNSAKVLQTALDKEYEP